MTQLALVFVAGRGVSVCEGEEVCGCFPRVSDFQACDSVTGWMVCRRATSTSVRRLRTQRLKDYGRLE